MKQFVLIIGLFIFGQTVRSQTSYTWTGSVSTSWNTAGNWAPAGIPGSIDNVTIVTGSNTCVLNASTPVNNITVTSGTLDLGGFTLSVSGPTVVFSTGTVQNGTVNITGATNTTFNGPLTMNCPVNITSASVTLKNTIFQNALTLTKTGVSNDNSSGNNIFNGAVTMTNTGAGYLQMGNGNPDHFNAAATFNNTGSSSIYVAYNSANNIFGGVTTFNNTPTTNTLIYISWLSNGTSFNDNIIVNSTNGQGVQFCGGNGTSTATLATGKTITIGASGFSAGTLLLKQFTQTGATAQNLTLTGTGVLTYGPSSSFGGNVISSSPAIFLNGCTFSGTTNITKTGASGDFSAGGNTFNGLSTLTNSGSSYFLLGNSNPDTWNNDVIFTDNGSERLLPCWASAGNQFNGNIFVNTSGSAQGIQFCGGNNTATATLAATKTIQPGAGGLTAGYLYLKQFTELGSAPINLTATGTSVLNLGPSSNFGGTFTATAPDIWAQGATYNSAASFTKTGGSSNHNNQNQNIFNSTCTINQQSNSGYFMLGYNSNDLFNDNITVTSTGSGGIYLGWTSGTGTPTLAAGKTISVGGAGFSVGFLYLNTFTQLGNTAISLAFTGASTYFAVARNSVIGGDLTITSPSLFFNGAIFNGAVTATKTGASGDFSQGGNTFTGLCSMTNSGGSYLVLGNSSPDIWNNDVIFTDNGSERLLPCWGSAGNQFNGNITVNTSGSAQGIQFCGGNSTATATLAAGKTIQAGATGLTIGYLILKQFTQVGNTPVNLTLTGATTYLQIGPVSAIGGDLTAVSPRILLNGAVYSGNVNVTKNGATGEWSSGGNTFNGTLTVNQMGAGFFGFANGAPDIYNGDVYANNNSTERIIFANNPAGNQFNGNIILTQIGSSQGIAFGWSSNTNETMAAGKTISIGAAGYSTGFLQIERFTQLGNAPVNLPLTGNASLTFGPASAIGGDLNSTSSSLFFNGCIFSGVVNSTKNGASNDASSGNNIFNGVTTMTNSGSGYLLFGNGNADQFNSAATFNNIGSSNIYVAYNSPNNIFGGVTTFINTPSTNNLIFVSWLSTGTIFNDNIIVSSSNGQGVQFCGGNGSATATLAANKTITIGAGGFSSGNLLLKQFTQLGATAQNLALTGTGIMTFGPSSSFGGDITASSPTMFLNGCVFNGASDITKTGSTGDYSAGGNTFNGICSLTNTGSSFFLLGNSAPDIWNNDVSFSDNGSERLLPCWAAVGNQFNGNIFVNTSGSAQGIQFCGGNSNATATLAATKTIQPGLSGLNAGYLILKQFTQLGNAAINLTLANTATYLQYGPSSSLGGDVTSSSPGLYFNGCTFSGIATCTKTGATSDASIGNNVFNGIATLTNTGAGYLMFGNGNRDQFNAAATFNNTGSNNIYVAYNSVNNSFGGLTTFNNSPTGNTGIYVSWLSPGTVFNNIVVTSTNGQGIQFCAGNGSANATLSAGNTISVGPAGFSAGILLLKQFGQTGPTPQSLTLTGTGNLTFGPSSAFGGNLTTVSPTLFYNGCVFGGTVTAAKIGSTNDASSGNNTFNGAFTVTNTGAGYLLMGNGNPDNWQSTATFNNLSSGQHMYTAYNSTGNIFNGDVIFNNQPGSTGLWIYPNYFGINTQFNGNISLVNANGAGVYFGTGSGTATLAPGGTVSIGAGGFNFGSLIFRSFKQSGLATAQNITTTGTSNIQYGTNASFDGAVTSSSPGLFFNGSTFNGTVNCIKTGTTNDQSVGNNTFNGSSTFTNNGTGYLLMTNTTPDTYKSDVSFVKNSSGLIYPNYNGNSVYAGNLSITSPASAISFGAGNGTATLAGTGTQNIGVTAGTLAPIFVRLVIANTGGGVTLMNTSINVSGTLVFNSGLLNTTTTYELIMLNGSSTSAGTSASTSYVNGPMAYQKSSAGSSTLNFPIGNSPDCRPFILTVNHTNGTLYIYQAQLFNASAKALGYTLPPSVDHVSGVHYYTIGRLNAAGVSQPTTGLSGNQTIQIFFGANDLVTNGATLSVVKNVFTAPTNWIDIGGVGGPAYSGGANLTGSVISTSAPSVFNSFSTFALADEVGGNNILPIGLLFFDAVADNNRVDLTWSTSSESNNSYFTIEKSQDGINFVFVQRVNTQAFNGNSNLPLSYSTEDMNPYTGLSYYRLKQTDLDGQSRYSRIDPVNFDQKKAISVYPNPTRGTVYISGVDISQTSLTVEWLDVSGRLLSSENVPAQGGIAVLNPHFNNGVYLLRFMSGGSFRMQNIIIMK
jgi:Secretion system C-terminal sorting domain